MCRGQQGVSRQSSDAWRPAGHVGTLGGMVFFAHQLRNHILHQVWTSPVNLRSPWLRPRGGEDSLRSASGPRRRGQGREGWGCEPGRAYRRIRCLQCLSGPRLCLFPAASPSSPLLRCHRTSSAPGAEVSQEAGRLSPLCLTLLSFCPSPCTTPACVPLSASPLAGLPSPLPPFCNSANFVPAIRRARGEGGSRGGGRFADN